MSHSKFREALRGARDTLPLIVAAIPFGIVYGALAISGGLSETLTMAMSLFVFAGSSQFVAVSLIAAASSLPVILMTVFIINLRHMLYAASLIPHVARLPIALRAIMAFWLTDETYAVVASRLQKPFEGGHFPSYYLGGAFAMYSNWQLCTWIGISLSHQVPDLTSWGLDIAMVVAFTGIVVPALQKFPQWACALTAGIAILLTYEWPHQSGLLFSSFLAIAVGLLAEKVLARGKSDV